MNHKNPWRGLVSYEEPKGSDDYLFCGRDEDALDLVRLTDNNLFVTLYGCSGIGKTSLLKAGVFPILRRKDYFPVYVRLSQEPSELSYAEAIIRKLQTSGLRELRSVETGSPAGDDRLCLWNYFAINRFVNAAGREVYPVIILDQFEEVFRGADRQKADLLLRQIYLLLDDELEMPDREGYSTDTNYRFVASIREDYLFVLEDSIDAFSLDLYKNNRYRLRPMRPGNAREVVLLPGRDCIEESEKAAVADRIVSLARRGDKEDIDTLLLSLVCAGTFDKKAGEKITLSDLAIWKDNPMQLYYQDAVKRLTAKQIRYIQQHLIREDGSRRQVDVGQVKAALGESTYKALIQGENRMLSLTGSGVELLHDKLGMAVYEERKAFEERERKKRLKRRIWLFGIGAFLIIILILNMLLLIGQQQTDLLKNRARFTAEKASQLADDGDLYIATMLDLEVLPEKLDPPGLSFTPEAEASLRAVLRHHDAVFRSHTGWLDKVSFSPTGDRFLSVDSGVSIWDINTGKCLRSLEVDGYATAGDFHPGGRQVAYSSDSLIVLYDLESDRILGTLIGHTRSIEDLRYNEDGSLLASVAGDDPDARIWEVSSGRCLQILRGHKKGVYSICFSPDGRYAVTSSSDQTIRIWDVSKGRCVRIIRNPAQLSDAQISPDGKLIASGSWDNTVRLWDFNTGRFLLAMNTPPLDALSGVYEVAFSPDGKTVAAAYSDDPGMVRLWDVATGKCMKEMSGHLKGVRTIDFSPDGKTLLSGSYDETIRTWMVLEEPEEVRFQREPRRPVFLNSANSAVFSPDGKRILAAYDDGMIAVWDADSHRCIDSLDNVRTVEYSQYSPDGKYIISASDGGAIRLWDAETSQSIKELYHDNDVYSVNFSHDGRHIVSASWDNTVAIWSIEGGHRECSHPDDVFHAVFSPDDKYVATACRDGVVRIWRVIRDAECIAQMEGHTDYVNGVAFSPDGRFLASASRDGTVRIWNLLLKSCILTIPFGPEGCHSVDYSKDGRYLLVSYGNDAIVLDASSGITIDVFKGHQKTVNTAFFSPDGRRIVSASYDNSVIIWDFPPLQELADQNRERFSSRPLTREEKKKYYLE